MNILYMRKTPARTTLKILGATVKKVSCSGQGFLGTCTRLPVGRVECDFLTGHTQVLQSGTLSRSTLRLTDLARVYLYLSPIRLHGRMFN